MKILPVVLLMSGVLLAQTAIPPELYFTTGTVLARGQNTAADGFYGLKSYRIEEVRLARPVDTEIAGRRQSVSRAFRVIISGETFQVRALPPLIWAGDKLIGKAQERQDLTEVVAVTFDAGAIPEGVVLSLSYGMDGERQSLREPIRYTVRPQ
jgi:hypothetical protein